MIYIITHKKVPLPELKEYKILQVGCALQGPLGYLRDDEGENISEKNPNFCELTGVYWIWKNVQDEYKGIVHYRRFFGKNNLSAKASQIYSYEEMVRLLKGVDIVLPYVENLKQNARDEILIYCCTEEIFDELEKIIQNYYPEYQQDFEEYFHQNKTTLFNMMFCRRELYDEYCEWLFDILFRLEKKVDLSELNEYQQRLYGFLSERLLNVWVKHKKLKVRNVPVIHTELSFGQRITFIRRRITNQIFYTLSSMKKNR